MKKIPKVFFNTIDKTKCEKNKIKNEKKRRREKENKAPNTNKSLHI